MLVPLTFLTPFQRNELRAQPIDFIGAGEGNRTLDTQLGKRVKARTRRTSMDGIGQIIR
jgi:hypothetical protein